MTGRATMLPVYMVVVIVVLAVIAIFTGRSNEPDISGDRTYPHFVCTYTEYCAGDACTRTPLSFVLYTAHSDGRPRIELPGLSERATLTEDGDALIFESTGGQIEGTITIYRERSLDFAGFAGEGDERMEHYGTGECEAPVTP